MYRVAVCDDCIKDGRQIFQWAEQIFAERKMEVALSLFHSPQDLLAQVTNRNRQEAKEELRAGLREKPRALWKF